MTVSNVATPSMTSSNSVSSGYCSQDEEGDDFTFFTAKNTFFQQAKQALKVRGTGAGDKLFQRWGKDGRAQ